MSGGSRRAGGDCGCSGSAPRSTDPATPLVATASYRTKRTDARGVAAPSESEPRRGVARQSAVRTGVDTRCGPAMTRMMATPRERLSFVGVVVAAGRARRRYYGLPRKYASNKCGPFMCLWTPLVVSVEIPLEGARTNRRSILVWEVGGTESLGELSVRHEVFRTRPALAVGNRYEMWLERSREHDDCGPGFIVLDAKRRPDLDLTIGLAIPAIPGPGTEAGGSPSQICGAMTFNARWDYDPPSMSWDESLLSDFGETLKDNYHAAAAKWSGSQGNAPQANGQDVEPIAFFAAVWDPDQFVNLSYNDFLGAKGAAMAINFSLVTPATPMDIYANTYTLVDTHAYLETCLGMIAPTLLGARVLFNTAYSFDEPNDKLVSPSSQGVWVHELGHLLGLTHRANCAFPTIMAEYGSVLDTWTNWNLSDDDDFRIRLLYPREQAFPVGTRNCP